jgi:arsenate reductase-like glutaredoxin family protein
VRRAITCSKWRPAIGPAPAGGGSIAAGRITKLILGKETLTSAPISVQIFGLKNSQASRAAERFFKERRVTIHFVDLKQRPMAPGEIKRFIDRFGLAGVLDTDGKSYIAAGMKYLKLSDSELLAKVERDPQLLRLPLVRAGNRLSIGHDEESWKAVLA